MTRMSLILLAAAAATLAGCETTGTSVQSTCLNRGYAAGSPEYDTCVAQQTRSARYVNKAYGNCGHCAGNTGR